MLSLSDSDDKPKVSSIKPLIDAKPKPPVSLVSLVSLEDFSATREAVTTPKKKPPITKPKPKARANGDDGDDDGARLRRRRVGL